MATIRCVSRGRCGVKKKDPRCRGSILIGAHDGQHAHRLGWIGGVLGAVPQVRIVVDLAEVRHAFMLDADEVVFAMRVVAAIEGLPCA